MYYLKRNKDIERDIFCWAKNYNIVSKIDFFIFIYLFFEFQEFRNLFYYRVKKAKSILVRILLIISKIVMRDLSTLYITSNNIGGGLFIQHGFSTIISAESIGENCWINQNVTIGFDEKLKAPVIGNNVRISTGAIA